MDRRRARVLAGAAAIAVTAGAVALVVAVAALPHPWTSGYVSEAGIGSRSGAYRFGIVALSAGLILLGGAIRTMPAATLLIAAGAFGAISAAVTCTAGCPLPPYEHAAPADLVHAAASCLSVGLTALAMLAIGSRLSRWAFAITAPIIAALGIGLLAIGRSGATAVLERIVLVLLVVWAVVTAIRPPIDDDRKATTASAASGRLRSR